MRSGLILAGGRGSRMGPLAAQISKALVSIGQRPHLIHQIDLMRQNDITDITVVVSPDTIMQVKNCVMRCGMDSDVTFIVQPEPQGPVAALALGLQNVAMRSVVLMMADTYVEEIPQVDGKNWVGVAPAPFARSFCYLSAEKEIYIDGPVTAETDVTVGIYEFNAQEAYVTACDALYRGRGRSGPEVPMSAFLNLYDAPAQNVDIPSWMDIGEVEALAAARKNKFIVRDHHALSFNDSAVVQKLGDGHAFESQRTRMLQMNRDVPTLVPRVYSSSVGEYSMDYVDLPTLSELFLYWPGQPETWSGIMKNVIDRMEKTMWSFSPGSTRMASSEEVSNLFIGKAIGRLGTWDDQPAKADAAIMRISKFRGWFADSPTVYAHGDLNWNNILYSLNSGMFKLIDPRGDTFLPVTYEIAKLAVSYDAGLAAITHGLTGKDGAILVKRKDEADAMNTVLYPYVSPDELQIAQAALLFAAIPFHSKREAAAMYVRGMEMLDDI